jgi:hypothetical protein
MQRGFYLATIPAAALLAVCFFTRAWADPIGAAAQTRAAEATAYPYYIEFRVALDGVYGHSYIAYGRLRGLGQPATATYADIHPTGDIPSMVLGHFFPMDAATSPEKDTLGFKIANRFRRPLTAIEYDRLKSIIARIRAARHAWSVLGYNCNDFVADVARGLGMRTPTTLLLPYNFIPELQAKNEHTLRFALAYAHHPPHREAAPDSFRTAVPASSVGPQSRQGSPPGQRVVGRFE